MRKLRIQITDYPEFLNPITVNINVDFDVPSETENSSLHIATIYVDNKRSGTFSTKNTAPTPVLLTKILYAVKPIIKACLSCHYTSQKENINKQITDVENHLLKLKKILETIPNVEPLTNTEE
jgi:hypothetical protein